MVPSQFGRLHVGQRPVDELYADLPVARLVKHQRFWSTFVWAGQSFSYLRVATPADLVLPTGPSGHLFLTSPRNLQYAKDNQ